MLHRGDSRRDHGHRKLQGELLFITSKIFFYPKTPPITWLVFLYAIILYILHMNHVNIHVLIIVQVQLYDPRTNGFAPSSPEIGMHVEIRDPEDKIILSKVRVVCTVSRVYVGSVGAVCTVCTVCTVCVPSVLFVYRLYCLCTVCTVCAGVSSVTVKGFIFLLFTIHVFFKARKQDSL